MITGACLCKKVSWRYQIEPERAVACNCTVCSRHGSMWIYGSQDKDLEIHGDTKFYLRQDKQNLGFHFCDSCGCTLFWKAMKPNEDGLFTVGINLRQADDPDLVGRIPLIHYDGLEKYVSVGPKGQTVKDLWH